MTNGKRQRELNMYGMPWMRRRWMLDERTWCPRTRLWTTRPNNAADTFFIDRLRQHAREFALTYHVHLIWEMSFALNANTNNVVHWKSQNHNGMEKHQPISQKKKKNRKKEERRGPPVQCALPDTIRRLSFPFLRCRFADFLKQHAACSIHTPCLQHGHTKELIIYSAYFLSVHSGRCCWVLWIRAREMSQCVHNCRLLKILRGEGTAYTASQHPAPT